MARSRIVIEGGLRLPRRASRKYRRRFSAYACPVRFEIVGEVGTFSVEELMAGTRTRWPTRFASRATALASVTDAPPR